jgi:hypothetical protein
LWSRQKQKAIAAELRTGIQSAGSMRVNLIRSRTVAGSQSRSALMPRRGREPKFSGGRLFRPDHRLLPILPLDCHCLLADLKSTLVNSEVAEDGFGFECK